jgi:hypothetical protein
MIFPIHTFAVGRGIEKENDFLRYGTADRDRLTISREKSS